MTIRIGTASGDLIEITDLVGDGYISGLDGNDTILAGGDDAGLVRVYGGNGDDRIDLRDVNGSLFGGDGDDVFVVTEDEGLGTVNREPTRVLFVGGRGFDLVDLSRSGAMGVSIDLTVPTGHSVFHFEGIEALKGTGGSDVLRGDLGNNVFFDSEGRDTYVGNGGVDRYVGLTLSSFDRWILDFELAYGSRASELAQAAGISVAAGSAVAFYTVWSDDNIDGQIDQSELTVQADVLTGIRHYEGGGAEREVFRGSSASETFETGWGSDTVIGGGGADVVAYETLSGGVSVSLATGTALKNDGFGDTARDSLSGISHVIGSGYADRLFGNGAANTLSGRNGNDLLDGASGNDVLLGEEGSDILVGAGGTTSCRVARTAATNSTEISGMCWTAARASTPRPTTTRKPAWAWTSRPGGASCLS